MAKFFEKILTICAIGTAFFATSAHATPAVVSANWNSHWSITNSSAVYTGCSNNNGDTISLSGNLATVGAVRATILATNNDIYTKSYTVVGTGTVDLAVAAGAPTTFQKQGSLGGVGGNPWIGWSYQSDGTQVSWLGRCVQGANGGNINGHGDLLNSITYTVSTSVCSPSESAFTHNGLNQANGLGGTIYLYNSTNNPQQTGTTPGQLSVGGNASLSDFTKQNKAKNQSLAGGNPRVYVKLQTSTEFTVDANGNVTSFNNPTTLYPVGAKPDGYLYVGRCKDLLQ